MSPTHNSSVPHRLNCPTVYIERAALLRNATLARKLAPQAKLLAMIKANAYGHGAKQVASTLADKVDGFGVSRIEEALELRESGIAQPIIIMSPLLDQDNISVLAKHHLTTVISCEKNAEKMIRQCRASGISYWVKFDSGMHRLGLQQAELPSQLLHGKTLMSHLKSAECADSSTTDTQLRRFCAYLKNHGIEQCDLSLANSASLLQPASTQQRQQHWQSLLPQYCAKKEIVRPGIMLYGSDPLEVANDNSRQLRPAMTFAAPVLATRQLQTGDSVGYNGRWCAQRPSTIATIAAGYGDGYPRHAIDGTPVLINGRRALLAGTVSMDMITVDITDLLSSGTNVSPGDSAILWGKELLAEEVARYSDSLSYQLFTAISARVTRQII